MPLGHLMLARIIRPSFLIVLASWIETTTPSACHAVLDPSDEPVVIAATPKCTVCPIEPDPNRSG